jgi:hypothetical protein
VHTPRLDQRASTSVAVEPVGARRFSLRQFAKIWRVWPFVAASQFNFVRKILPKSAIGAAIEDLTAIFAKMCSDFGAELKDVTARTITYIC